MNAFNILSPGGDEIYATGKNSTIRLVWVSGGPTNPDNNNIIVNLGTVTPAEKGTQGQIILTNLKGKVSKFGPEIGMFEWIIPDNITFDPQNQYYFHLRSKEEPPVGTWRYSGFFRIVKS